MNKLNHIHKIKNKIASPRIKLGTGDIVYVLRNNGCTADNRKIGAFIGNMRIINDDCKIRFIEDEFNYPFKKESQGEFGQASRGTLYEIELEYLPTFWLNIIEHFTDKGEM